MLFLVGREAHAYVELKREVGELKRTVGSVEDSFKRATAEQMTFVRQATKQLVDLSTAHTRLEELVADAGRRGGGGAGTLVGLGSGTAGADVLSMGGVDVGGTAAGGGKGGGGGGLGGAGWSGGSGTARGRQRQRPRQAAGGGGGNLRGGGGGVTSSDDGLWETSGSEAKAAGGLAKTVKEGELPWDS